MMFRKKLEIGKSRKKTELIDLVIKDLRELDGSGWSICASLAGGYSFEKVLEATSEFEAFILAIAYLRQALRQILKSDKNLKLYDYDGELFEVLLEDVFWVHDCIPEEMVNAYEWAKANGYKPT